MDASCCRLHTLALLPAAAFLLVLAGCKPVGPNYTQPQITAPAAYKETGSTAVQLTPPAIPTDGGWQKASPTDAADRGKWWLVFADPQLNQLEDRIATGNQALRAAMENYQAARSLVRSAHAAALPTVSAGPGITGYKYGANNQSYSSARTYPRTDYNLEAAASWEPDLWGQVRRSVESAQATADSRAALAASVALTLQGELATDYYTLRGLDAEQRMLTATVAQLERQLALTETRLAGGVGTAADVAQARTQLETVRAQVVEVGVTRAQNEHAIAALCGLKPSELSIPASPLDAAPALALPKIPVGLPSEILERRPDIANAERSVAAANAQIGIAQSAFYPNITLSAAGGFDSMHGGTLFQGPSTLWSLGASAAQLLFDGGRRHAITDEARHSYEASAATYRDTVLSAFADVENQLSTLRILEQESEVEARAVASAQHSLDLAQTRYKGGVATYLEVITAETALLTNQRTAIDLESRRFTASVSLIRALGGGWDRSQIPH